MVCNSQYALPIIFRDIDKTIEDIIIKLDYNGKFRWIPRIPETLQNAQAKLRDPEKGNYVYIRKYETGIHSIVVDANNNIITQFYDITGNRRDYFNIVWEKRLSATPGSTVSVSSNGGVPSESDTGAKLSATPGSTALPVSSNGGVPSESGNENTLPPISEKSSQGGKNLITRDHVDDAFGTIGREARATKAVYANHNDILDTLKGTDADKAWKQLAPSLLAFAGDLKGINLSTPAIDAAIETLGGIDDLPEAFDRFRQTIR